MNFLLPLCHIFRLEYWFQEIVGPFKTIFLHVILGLPHPLFITFFHSFIPTDWCTCRSMHSMIKPAQTTLSQFIQNSILWATDHVIIITGKSKMGLNGVIWSMRIHISNPHFLGIEVMKYTCFLVITQNGYLTDKQKRFCCKLLFRVKSLLRRQCYK